MTQNGADSYESEVLIYVFVSDNVDLLLVIDLNQEIDKYFNIAIISRAAMTNQLPVNN